MPMLRVVSVSCHIWGQGQCLGTITYLPQYKTAPGWYLDIVWTLVMKLRYQCVLYWCRCSNHSRASQFAQQPHANRSLPSRHRQHEPTHSIGSNRRQLLDPPYIDIVRVRPQRTCWFLSDHYDKPCSLYFGYILTDSSQVSIFSTSMLTQTSMSTQLPWADRVIQPLAAKLQ